MWWTAAQAHHHWIEAEPSTQTNIAAMHGTDYKSANVIQFLITTDETIHASDRTDTHIDRIVNTSPSAPSQSPPAETVTPQDGLSTIPEEDSIDVDIDMTQLVTQDPTFLINQVFSDD